MNEEINNTEEMNPTGVGNVDEERPRRSKWRFILARDDDRRFHSIKWIVGYGLLFWLISRFVGAILVTGSSAIYGLFGINVEEMTKFGGDPTVAGKYWGVGFALVLVMVIAPVLEEAIFRLGLSFKRWQIALAAAAIPTYILMQQIQTATVTECLVYAAIAVAVFLLIYLPTTDSFWNRLKGRWFRPMIWVSAIAFGLIHLMAFSNHDIVLLPYQLCVVSLPFFGGCAITYYRVNLGFWAGVALHIFNNLPAVFIMLGQ